MLHVYRSVASTSDRLASLRTLHSRTLSVSRVPLACRVGIVVCCALSLGLLASPALAGATYSYDGVAAWDLNGSALADVGDVDDDGTNDFAVGAYAFDGIAGSNTGRVLVCSGATGAVIRTLEGEAAGDWFGWSVGPAGDADNDGFADFAIGAPRVDGLGGTDCGRVYVYSGQSGILLREIDGDAPFDRLGWAVGSPGDPDLDAFDDVAIGAPFHDGPAGVDAGKLILISVATGVTIRTFHGQAAGDRLGIALDARPDLDLDLDGIGDIAVAAPGHDGPAGTDAGRVYVQSGVDGASLFTLDGETAEDAFGSAVAIIADIDADNRAEVVVGAPEYDTTGETDAGRVTVHAGFDGTVLHTIDGDSDGERCGAAVSAAGDVDDDGTPDILTGSPDFDGVEGNRSGRVRSVSGVDGAILQSLEGVTAGERCGAALAGPGDLDGDQRADLLVGAPNRSSAASNAGNAKVFFLPAEPSCIEGSVNIEGVEGVTPVLFLNGSSGNTGPTVFLTEAATLAATIVEPPAGGNGKFVVHANAGFPDDTTTVVLPASIGTACFEVLLQAGAMPIAVWNNIGKESKVGASAYFDGMPIADPERAPATWLDLPTGDPVHLSVGTVITFQGVIVDPMSASPKLVSVTNAVILEIL